MLSRRTAMAQQDGHDSAAPAKRSLDAVSVTGSSTSDDSSAARRERKRKRRERQNGSAVRDGDAAVNGRRPSAFEQRRNSLGKAARDPRDEPPTTKRVTVAGQGQKVRAPSPVIEADGLSRPSKPPAPMMSPAGGCQLRAC